MIGKVKQWLGIEGVKLELSLPEGQALANGSIRGTIRFQSMNPQTVTGIRVVLIERYSRGRKEERLIDEYELGRLELKETFEVLPEQLVEKEFTMAARWLRKAESQFRVEAEAKVKGVALNPFDKKVIELA